MHVDIIIPTLNNMELLPSCIAEIRKTCSEIDHTIVIAANACSEEMRAYVSALNNCILIAFDKNLGFGKACNEAFKKRWDDRAYKDEESYVLFLNDDTLPTADWLTNLIRGFRIAREKVGNDGRIGAVGPVSNFVAGNQKLRLQNMHPYNRQEIRSKLIEGAVGITHFLSGFCIMLRAKIFMEMGYFDEEFPYGAEDNALCTKLLSAGYHLFIVCDSYVYHHGSATLNSTPKFRLARGGVAYVPKYFEKYRVPQESTEVLGVVYRVKLRDNRSDIKYFVESLCRSLQFADKILILDDGSAVDVKAEVNEAILAVRSSIKCELADAQVRKYNREFDERRDRNELYQWAVFEGCTWVMSIDADEVVEDKVTREYMQRLMHPPIPHLFAYSVHFYTMWNSEDSYRSDGLWGRMLNPRIYRIQPNRAIVGGAKSTLHVEHIPRLPDGCIGVSSIRIKHYGYVDRKERERKFDYYQNLDQDKQPGLIGGEDYGHIVDESGLFMRDWVEDNSICIASIVKDEILQLPEFIQNVWPFVDNIHLEDTGSTDGSIEFLESCNVDLSKLAWRENFGLHRNNAVARATDTWVLQLDMDERVPDWAKVRRMLDVAGANAFMFYVENIAKNGKVSVSETVRLFKSELGLRYSGRIHETVDNAMRLQRTKPLRSIVNIVHLGFLRDDGNLKGKFFNYMTLNLRDLQENPDDPRAYYNIALHLGEEPKYLDLAMIYLAKSIQLDPKFYQPMKDLAAHHIKRAHELFSRLVKILPPDHIFSAHTQEKLDMLDQLVPKGYNTPEHIKEFFDDPKNGFPNGPPIDAVFDVLPFLSSGEDENNILEDQKAEKECQILQLR